MLTASSKLDSCQIHHQDENEPACSALLSIPHRVLVISLCLALTNFDWLLNLKNQWGVWNCIEYMMRETCVLQSGVCLTARTWCISFNKATPYYFLTGTWDFEFFQTELAESGLPVNTVAVVSLAGQNVLNPTRRWTPGFKQNVWASRVNTTRSLADAIIKAPFKPKVFISISGVGKTVRSLIIHLESLLISYP